jgi:predicted HD phosphohydrolase
LFHDVGKIILVQNAKNNPDAPVESVDHEQLGANFLKKMGFS